MEIVARGNGRQRGMCMVDCESEHFVLPDILERRKVILVGDSGESRRGDFGGDLCDFVHNYLRSLSANITSSAALLVVFMIGVKRFFSQKCSD